MDAFGVLEEARRVLRKVREVTGLGIYDRVEARRGTLHSDGFYSGVLTHDEVEEELRKVEKLIEDVEKPIRRARPIARPR